MSRLGGVELFVTSEEPEYSVQVSSHNIEKGGSITDHIQKEGVTLHLEGLLLGPQAANYRHRLVAAMNGGKVLQYVGRNSMVNAVITSLRTSHDYSIANGMSFSLTLKEIQLVKVAYKGLPGKSQAALKAKSRSGKRNTSYLPTPQEHLIRTGQTWETIAKSYQVDSYQLRTWNPHLDPNFPPPAGMVLSIGKKATKQQQGQNTGAQNAIRTYTVRAGETWNTVAFLHGMSVLELQARNPNINPRSWLREGMVLKID